MYLTSFLKGLRDVFVAATDASVVSAGVADSISVLCLRTFRRFEKAGLLVTRFVLQSKLFRYRSK